MRRYSYQKKIDSILENVNYNNTIVIRNLIQYCFVYDFKDPADSAIRLDLEYTIYDSNILSTKQLIVVHNHLVRDINQMAIAKGLRISQQRVSEILLTSLEVLVEYWRNFYE